ncbi:MAG: hypothetical protein HGA67_00220 [Candidatus Yonathbacteria bacterium]|nr:hypothetical protein [Candidatus Yonathbacteria bacterium]
MHYPEPENTFKKSISSRPRRQLDSVVRKKKISPSGIVASESDSIASASSGHEPSVEEAFDADVDGGKRMFLKVAGVAGLGLAASTLLPKQAEAYVSGSTPTSSVVGVKKADNTRIDPATETKQDALLTELRLKADLTETQPVSVTGTVAVGVTGTSNVIGVTDALGARMTPAQDDTVIMLRRMVKLMESQAVVDNQMRQRVVVDSGSLTTAGTISTVTTVSAVTTLNQIAGVDARWQIIDWSRQAYNSGIRSNLINV